MKRSDFRVTFTPLAREALREMAAREGQTQAAFLRAAVLPILREEMRAIAARIQKKTSVIPHAKHCPNCGAA